jgi:YegS/Rv2252/BmrU family lipid kinase
MTDAGYHSGGRTPLVNSTLPLLVILNPAAGRGRARSLRDRLRRALLRRRIAHDWQETLAPGHAAHLAGSSSRDSHSRVLIVGGDGTISDVAPSLAGRSDAPPMALIPGGTGNDTAKTLGVAGLDFDASLRIGLEGREIRLDAGRMNDTIFVNGFGAGLDGSVVAAARRVPWIRGIAPYLIGLGMTLPAWHPFRFQAQLDEETIEGEATLVTFANGKICGGGFRLTPLAIPDDGMIDACIVGPHGRLAILHQLPKAIAGRHLAVAGTTYRQVRRVSITFSRPIDAHVDGNLIRSIDRAEVVVLPGAIAAISAG